MAETDREWARVTKTRAKYDRMAEALRQVVDNYNEAVEDLRDRIRILGPEALPDEAQGVEDRIMVLLRRHSFVKVMMESAGSIQIAWSYQVPATGSRVYPDVNRLMLDSRNSWQFYRFHDSKEVHLERFDPDAGRLAKVLVERLISMAAIPPEVQPVLAL